MHTRFLKRYALFIGILSYQIEATVVIRGDSTAPDATFSFPLSVNLYEKTQGFLLVGAQTATQGAAAPYAVAVAGGTSSTFSPLVGAATATVNGQENQPNPLNGAAINQLAMFDFTPQTIYPVVVTQAEPGIVYLLANGVSQSSPLTLLQSTTLLDAYGQQTNRIAALMTNFPTAVFDSQRLTAGLQKGFATFAAVTNPSGIFGEPGSGIATEVIATNTTKNMLAFTPLLTATLDVTSSFVAIGDPLTAMADFATLSNFSSLTLQEQVPSSQMFVGLQVVGGTNVTDGAIGVVTFNGAPAALGDYPQLQPIVTSSAVAADAIVAAVGPSAAVNIYALANMKTTTQLRYLIVLGGVAPYGTQRTIFALPLVSTTGQLADVTAQPITQFDPFLQRTLPAATAPDELYTSTAVQAVVGGGAMAGDVSELFVSGDTVFASMITSTLALPGIFYSQALFDATGKIQGWTQWQRVGNATTGAAGLALDEHTGNFWSLINSETGSTVTRTVWEKPQQGVQQFVQEQFAQVPGGVQGLVDIPAATAALNQSDPLSVTIATGNNQVVIAQSGQTVAGILNPVTDFSNGFVTTNGTLQNFAPGVTSLTMAGGALASLGALIAATIITDGTYAWFAVAGANGLAVLARPDGTSWLLSSGLQTGFQGLTSDMRWVACGTYQAVRRLVANENALYILTQTTLERIALSPALFQNNNSSLNSIVLAEGGNLPDGLHIFLSDVIVSQKVALLATSSGLLRVGNGTDITAAMNAAQVQWTPLTLVDSVGPVTRLFGISVTGVAEDLVQLAPGVSGNVYALNGYVGYDQARVYRFTINYSGTIDDTTIQLVPDTKITGVNSFFLTFGYYRNYITTDGAIFAVSRSKYLPDPTKLQLLPPVWVTGNSAGLIAKAANILDDPEAHSIGQMIRSSVTGAWLVPGEFGLFVNE